MIGRLKIPNIKLEILFLSFVLLLIVPIFFEIFKINFINLITYKSDISSLVAPIGIFFYL